MTPRVAVVFLARVPEGIDVFRRFADSYRKFDAGYPHELILIEKGLQNRGEQAYIDEIFRGIRYQTAPISDEGFDINAYLHFAEATAYDYYLFINTHTEILAPDWLAKMMAHATAPDVGFIGATASYESISRSQKLISQVVWMAQDRRFPFDEDLYAHYKHYLNLYAARWVKLRKLKRRILSGSAFYELFHGRPDLTAVNDGFETSWASTTSDNGPQGDFRKFPYFPNPHLRSNCFLIARDRLLALNFRLKPTKIDCNFFESGVWSLSAILQRQALKLLLVGADGAAFDVRDWPKSGTFRLGNQENLLFGDNQTRSYQALSEAERKILRLMTWGDYVPNDLPERMKLGLSFEQNESLLAGRPPASELMPADPPQTFISIVIPTHNRLALVADAIESVRRDRTHKWELVVFDNASEEPLKEHVESLNDDRIRFFRSDAFLPVTDSWNTAIEKARGEYVMLLGDDDGLTPGFFKEVNGLIQYFDRPDMIYCGIYQFCHPGVAPWQRAGYVSDLRNGFFFAGRDLPFVLSEREKAHAIDGSLGLRRNFSFNMQCMIFHRRLLDKLSPDGKLFRTPFPDYYIANVAFAEADKIVAHPRPLTIAGISRQSFGYTLFNDLEEAGAKLLKTDLSQHQSFEKCRAYILPGPAYNTNYIVTMQAVRDALPQGKYAPVDFERYRKRQIASFIPENSRGLNWIKGEAAGRVWRALSLSEKRWALRLSISRKNPKRRRSYYNRRLKRLSADGFDAPQMVRNVGDYVTTMDLYEALVEGLPETSAPAP